MILHDYIRVCHKCPHRQQVCAGPCPCTIDGLDILEHARTAKCPKGFYDAPTCENCGGAHATASCPIPVNFDPERERQRMKQGGCCGAPSQGA